MIMDRDELIELFWTLVLMFPLIFWLGYVASTMWNWFVVATFIGAPTLTTPQTAGLSLVLGLTRYKASTKDTRPPIVRMIELAVYGAMVLGVGFVLHTIWK